MKKYVYSKGAEAVTVETDGLATINNFMVTGLIGKNYHGLVQAGLNFKMGDEVTIPMMLNCPRFQAKSPGAPQKKLRRPRFYVRAGLFPPWG